MCLLLKSPFCHSLCCLQPQLWPQMGFRPESTSPDMTGLNNQPEQATLLDFTSVFDIMWLQVLFQICHSALGPWQCWGQSQCLWFPSLSETLPLNYLDHLTETDFFSLQFRFLIMWNYQFHINNTVALSLRILSFNPSRIWHKFDVFPWAFSKGTTTETTRKTSGQIHFSIPTTVSPLHTNLQVGNFQRCKCAYQPRYTSCFTTVLFKVCVCLVTQSYLTLCNPKAYSLPGSSVQGFPRLQDWILSSFWFLPS